MRDERLILRSAPTVITFGAVDPKRAQKIVDAFKETTRLTRQQIAEIIATAAKEPTDES